MASGQYNKGLEPISNKLDIGIGQEHSSLLTQYTIVTKNILISSEDVDFCGYTVPHPGESKMHFRIQSRQTPALEVLKRGLSDLEKVCDHTINLFEKEIKDFSKT